MESTKLRSLLAIVVSKGNANTEKGESIGTRGIRACVTTAIEKAMSLKNALTESKA